MTAMTLHAKERLGSRQQRPVHRPVRRVAIAAVFRHITVLECERPLLLHVTADAGLLRCNPSQQAYLHRTMDIVAVGAGHLLFVERVAGKEAVLDLHVGVTAIAELRHFIVSCLLLRPEMELVAIEAAYVIPCMRTGVPEGKCRR